MQDKSSHSCEDSLVKFGESGMLSIQDEPYRDALVRYGKSVEQYVQDEAMHPLDDTIVKSGESVVMCM